MKIGLLLRNMRKLRGFTQKDLAKIIGKTDAYINLLENDMRSPSLNTLVKLADALAIQPGDFFQNVSHSDLIDEMRDEVIKTKQAIPIHELKYFDASSSKAWETLLVRFGTKRALIAGIKLYDDSMSPEFLRDDIVIIDRRYCCRTDRKTGSENLPKRSRVRLIERDRYCTQSSFFRQLLPCL